MEDFDTAVQAANQIPMWVNVFIGIVTALGGWEAIKYLISLRSNKRKDKAEADEAAAVAHQQAATAGQSDADWRQKELELMTSFVDTAKKQYEDLTHRYDDLKAEKEEDRKIKLELRKEIGEMRLVQAEQERKVTGLQRAFTESESRRREAERLYCSIEECAMRRPPIGTYNSDTDKAALRDARGRFIKVAPAK